MPIVVKDFTWTQTDKSVNIRIPLPLASHEKVDLFTTDSYIKAHFKPFIFEIFLQHDVDIGKSKSVIREEMITLDLEKREEVEWDSLEKDLSKSEKMEMKRVIIERCQEKAKQESEDKRVKKSEMDRFAVQKAMEIDNIQHNIMDSRRNEERKKAMDNLEAWRQIKNENGAKIVELTEYDKIPKNMEIVSSKPEYEANKKAIKSMYVDKKKDELSKRILPKLRETRQIEITHTARSFPTPSRESMAREEEEWLQNVTKARRATGFVSEDLRPEEQDPQWCKEKGDEFFKKGNLLGAISAYTHGISLSDKLPSLYSNRAATHFALGNFNKCVQDCSTALELLKPPCEGNKRSRAKCIARRGAALARLGYLNKGIDEMKAAAYLLPDDEKIKQDIYDMERAWEQNPDSD